MSKYHKIPKISIVVPSYNQAHYLEACINSILQQDYPNIEIIVMDGGSTDGSVEIIQHYANRLTYWQSQPDGGQSAALQAGFDQATGDLFTWLNSDDILLPNALQRHSHAFRCYPKADVFYGNHLVIDASGNTMERYKHPPYYNQLALYTMPYIAQPGTSFTQRIWNKVGGLDSSLNVIFDYDLWFRFMILDARFVHVGGFVAGFRKHPESKGATWLETYAYERTVFKNRYKSYLGNSLKRIVACISLMSLNIFSGAYIYTLAYRLFYHHRLLQYKPE
ncbi:glycosyltransferase [Candidatus Magnetomoraceae bacterium gMMP-1]